MSVSSLFGWPEVDESKKMLLEQIRSFAQGEVAPKAKHFDETGEFPSDVVKQLGEMGLMGMMVPEEWGGAGMDAVSYAMAMEEISAACASTGVIMSVNNSLVCAPLVWVLDSSSALVFRILGLNRESEDQVTAEELHLIVAEASKSGVIEEHERTIISGVVRLADRPVREVMTPRTEVDWLDCNLDADRIRERGPHALLGQPFRHPEADTAVAAGHQHRLAGQIQAPIAHGNLLATLESRYTAPEAGVRARLD